MKMENGYEREKGARNCHANLYASYSNEISQNYDTNHVRIIPFLLYEGLRMMSRCASCDSTASSVPSPPLTLGHTTETKDESRLQTKEKGKNKR
jgi:hypothetical protein